MLCNADRCSRQRASLRRGGPSGFAARLAQRVLEVGDRLLVLRHGRRFLVNFSFCVGQVLPVVLLPHRCVRVAVILLLLQIVFPLQDVEFVSVVREFLSRVCKGFPPIRFVLSRTCFVVRGRGLALIDCRRCLGLVLCGRGLVCGRGRRLTNHVDRTLDGINVVVRKNRHGFGRRFFLGLRLAGGGSDTFLGPERSQ